MDLSGCRFIYAGTASEVYGLRFVNCETSEYKKINGTTKSINVYNGHNKRNYLISDDYSSSPISIDIEIAADDMEPFTPQTLREIENWLFNRPAYSRLYINIDDDCNGETYEIINTELKQFYFNCRFTNPSKLLGNGGVVGFRATMECDSHILWQDEIAEIFSMSNSSAEDSSIITVSIGSDGYDYIYPKVTLTMGSSGGDISIINNSDDSARITSFKAITAGTTFYMDSELLRISGDNYTKFYDKNFIRLLPGDNSLAITGDIAEVKIEWANRKYL